MSVHDKERTKKLHNAIKLCNLIIRLDRQLLQIIINWFLWTQKFKWGIQQKWSWSRSHHCVCQLFPLNRGSWTENPLPNISGQLNAKSFPTWKPVSSNYQFISFIFAPNVVALPRRKLNQNTGRKSAWENKKACEVK